MAQYNEMQFVIVDPVNPSNNTARNSQQTVQILEKFRTVHKSLKLLSNEKQQQFLKEMSTEQQQLSLQMQSSESKNQAEESEKARQTAESGTGQTSREAELTDGATRQQVIKCPAIKQKAKEQQQQLLPAESAEQDCSVGTPEKQTSREVIPASPSPSHFSTDGALLSSAATERPSPISVFDSIDFVARFLSPQQPQDGDSLTSSGPSSMGGRV